MWIQRPSVFRFVCLRTSIIGLTRNSDTGVLYKTCVKQTGVPVNRLTDSHILPRGVNELRHISYLLAYLSKIHKKNKTVNVRIT